MAASSRVIYRQSLPGVSELGADSVLLFDRQLIKRVPGFRRWAAQFPFRFEVEAGEGLKSLEIFSDLARKLVRRTAALPVGALRIVGVGGGSVGDFAGFLASVFKRGVDLVHVPSTWLAAIDSSHGGKTALNVGGAKNQLGTFYPASRIYLVKELLLSQPEERAQDALGELSKIALIDGRPWVRNLMDSRLQGGKLLWRYLPEAVDSKYRVVDRDPFEKKRIRQLLNLGHTLGHVLEAYHGLAHGDAVGQGLLFALQWSERRGELGRLNWTRITSWLEGSLGIRSRARALGGIPEEKFFELLQKDKKRDTPSSVLFIFLEGVGRARLRSVGLDELAREARRQGWVKGAR